jgi:nickel-dependent lactate racemase
MTTQFRYGAGSIASLRIDPARLLAQCHAPRGAALADPAAAVREALENPLEFPPLARATVPGDRIVVAVESGGPRPAALAAGVVRAAVASGAEPDQIQIVSVRTSDDDHESSLRDAWDDTPDADLAAVVQWIEHDPADRSQLAYLAASRQNLPILFHRALCDADLVIPVGYARLDSVFGTWGDSGGVYPTFSDTATIERFRSIEHFQSPAGLTRLRQDAADAAEQLGIFFGVLAVPDAMGELLHVVAGKSSAVARRAADACRAAWRHSVPRRASLVIASVVGGRGAQGWDNVARAIAAAAKIVEPGGAIAICGDLAASPGAALARLARASSAGGAVARMRRDRSPDGWAAFQLAQVLDEVSVYLLSELAPEVVEGLGVTPIANLDEVERLAASHPSCILLEGAQYIAVELENDA